MTTVTLHAGTVSHSGTPGSMAGTGAIWDDGSDSTYIQSNDTEGAGQLFVGFAPLDVLTLPSGATVNSVTVNARAAMVGGSDTPARASIAVYQGSFPPFGASWSLEVEQYVTGGWQIEATTPTDYTHTFDATDFTDAGTSLAALVTALTSGASIWAYTLSVTGHTGLTVSQRFYELSVTVDYSTGGVPITFVPQVTQAPPLRQYPRSDGLGTSNARRAWPPTPSPQSSNRRVGGYL